MALEIADSACGAKHESGPDFPRFLCRAETLE